MLTRLANWLDDRTGYRSLVKAMLLEHIPGGAKWRYVWGSCLAFVFMIQLVTGLMLMTAYSPGDSTSWASVYYIQYEMDFGWLIRGLHHFGSQTMVVLLAIHMLQVVIAGAHLPPREINWWLGLMLMGIVLALSLTGYLLPWDQKGYWATQVATNIAGNMPGVGSFAQKVIVGGTEYGHQTLTRFYTLHVGILPPMLIVLLILHIAVFRRHGVTTPKNPGGKGGWFWPDQAFRDLLVGLVVFGIMVGVVVGLGHGQKIDAPNQWTNGENLYEKWAHAGQNGMGANLDAPADRATESYPARPEWYFLFLFQLLKYFEGDQEILGTLVIPNAVVGLLFLLPLLGYGRMRKFGHVFGVIVVSGLLLGVGVLTYLAIHEDYLADTKKAKTFEKDSADAAQKAHRAVNVARDGIPAEGAVQLLRKDPMTQGAKLFGRSCAACHNHEEFKSEGATASTLTNVGTEQWIYRLLRNPGHPDFFGRTDLSTMAGYIEGSYGLANLSDKQFQDDIKDLEPEQQKADRQEREKQLKELQLLAKWLASHPGRATAEDQKEPWYTEGEKLFNRKCQRCHGFDGKEPRSERSKGPDLTGYMDHEWMRKMIMAPNSELRYGRKNTMTAFRPLEGPTGELHKHDWANIRQMMMLRDVAPLEKEVELLEEALQKLEEEKGNPDEIQDTKKAIARKKESIEERTAEIEQATGVSHLSDIDRELIIRWLLQDGRVVFGGETVSGAKK